MISRNDPCFCGSGKKWKKCHYPEMPSEPLRDVYQKKYDIDLKTPEQIEGIRQSAKLAAAILKKVCDKAKAGVTTNELDAYAAKLHKEANARPAPLGYGHPPFPKSICTSLNEVICHGIPNDEPLKIGDILNIDVSCELNGYYGDCSAMVMVGEVDDDKKLVTEVSKECLMRSIEICRPGALVCDIGTVIEEYARSKGCSVVNQFVGHGCGLEFHEPPQIPHHYNKLQIPFAAGMTFTIEPMINAGVREGEMDPHNHWEARTLDGKPSAQWEHQILITDGAPEILTLSD